MDVFLEIVAATFFACLLTSLTTLALKEVEISVETFAANGLIITLVFLGLEFFEMNSLSFWLQSSLGGFAGLFVAYLVRGKKNES
ncbi:MAG: hypothetical protein AAGD25_06740 [Cyanobacteria bacterium P01_F01_bin.150]